MDGSYAAEDSIRFTLTVKPNELKVQERGEECLKAVVEALEKEGEGGGKPLWENIAMPEALGKCSMRLTKTGTGSSQLVR